ncbi:LysR family transcriptional regulator [Pseudoduganella sp. FT25W]|uniref:LysR family transcriptional regulator n=1 Tax=Duganella alba TaxID=2666081 RepID=A0A6L5QL12_9BURK|nr:LysR family transcriptional regulator [Duganella alba]MRX09631.1 LysR family transcriptional regulator [Duganella alba]MRX19656.1 LysR family transcriptional regulator [Duganella alba]
MMNLSHWRLLVAVADTRHISRAAQQVGISQSGASQAIAQIEAALGAKLFVRERREVAATALGEQVMRHARAMLAQFDAIRALGDAAQGLNAGRIRLATFPSVLATVLPGLLSAFKRRHPGIDVVALEGSDEEVEAWLAEETIELGVVLNPAAQRQAVIIGRDAWVALLPAHHPLGRRSSEQGVALSELADEPFVLATGGCNVHAQSLAMQAGVTLSDIRVTVRDLASAAVLVREGLGVSVVPESALPPDQRGVRVMQLQPRAYREFGLVCSQAGRESAAVQAFLREL